MRINEIRGTDEEELVKSIKKKCAMWLEHTDNGKHYVYRGLTPSHNQSSVPGFSVDDVSIKPIRKDRRNLGSNFYRKVYDQVLTKLGAPAQRSNSVSVTSDIRDTKQFGSTYVFLPIGEFHYTWSTLIKDWGGFTLIDGENEEYYQRFRRFKKTYPEKTELDFMAAYIEPTIMFDDFGPGDVIYAIESENEISIHAASGLYMDESIYKRLQEKLA